MSGSAGEFARHFDVSRETLDRLLTYEALLAKWNAAINLVSPATLGETWARHFIDSAQLFSAAERIPDHWADLGTGGGFPGLVIAIMAREKAPKLRMTLVESDKRKAAFLLTVINQLGLNATVCAERIEVLPPLGADIVTARALAPLDRLLAFAQRHLNAEGEAMFLKGSRWQEEVASARQSWSFSCETRPSLTQPEAVIMKIKGLHRV